MKCPYCNSEMIEPEYVDVGFGGGANYGVQVTPWECGNCGAREIGAYDEPRELTEREKCTGFYEPLFSYEDGAK